MTFGEMDAVNFNVVSDTEIHASYPTLVAGTYPVKLSNNTSIVPFTDSVTVIDPPNFVAGTLQYPKTPQHTLALLYDSEREALLVVASYYDKTSPNTSRTQDQLLRYQFSNGVFNSLTTLEIPDLQDISLSPDGKQLLALTKNQIIHLIPDTLSEIRRST